MGIIQKNINQTPLCLLSEHKGVKLESKQKDNKKISKHLEVNQHISKQHMGRIRNLNRNQRYFELKEKTTYQNMWDARKEIYSTGFMLERRYVTNQSLFFHFKTPGKE